MSLVATDLTLQRGHRLLMTGFDLVVEAGEGVTLRGPNGSGKTTLLRTLAGLHEPKSGKVSGHVDVEEGILRVSFLGHHDPIKASEALRDHFGFWADQSGAPQSQIAEVANQVGLTRQLALPGGVLSAGQRRRASMARLLLERRNIWLLDEPSAPLDAEGRKLLGHLLDTHRAQGGLFVAAVHDDLPGGPTRNISFEAP